MCYLVGSLGFGFLMDGGLMTIMGGIISALAVAMGIIWFSRMSSTCLAITGETAGGFDNVEDWHSGEWVERFAEFLCVLSSGAWVAVLAWGVDSAAVAAGSPRGVGIAVTYFFAFPVVLLSMLETGTWISPYSAPLWGSLSNAWRGWLGFYFVSATLAEAVAALAIGLLFALGPVCAGPLPHDLRHVVHDLLPSPGPPGTLLRNRMKKK